MCLFLQCIKYLIDIIKLLSIASSGGGGEILKDSRISMSSPGDIMWKYLAGAVVNMSKNN